MKKRITTKINNRFSIVGVTFFVGRNLFEKNKHTIPSSQLKLVEGEKNMKHVNNTQNYYLNNVVFIIISMTFNTKIVLSRDIYNSLFGFFSNYHFCFHFALALPFSVNE